LPSINSPSGALPARFRRERLLIVGCGDVGQRVARDLGGRMQLVALTSSAGRVGTLRAAGIRPLVGNLDDPATLRRLAGIATRVLHLAPPARDGGAAWWRDQRTTALARALRLRSVPSTLVYGSTSGVYGNCEGAHVSETRAVRPDTPRAHRRVDAERAVRWLGRSAGVRASILRIPGIYAPDRENGTPRARLERGTPVLRREDDVYTNHIHADDLARACVAALFRGKPQRIVHASDDTEIMAQWRHALTRPSKTPSATRRWWRCSASARPRTQARQRDPRQARRQQPGRLGEGPAGPVMIKRAEERGEIKPGDTLIEATSGNTGIALAMAAAIKGYRMVLIMPEDLSIERAQTMKAFGAELCSRPRAAAWNTRATWPRTCSARARAACSTSSPTPTTRASTTRPPAPNCGSRPAGASRTSSARWARRAPSPACRAS
jgi:nucleoside-diphosphate-sugar epimerase